MKITSKLPNQATSIFAVMSQLAEQHKAINLSQGFPDFPMDEALIDLVHSAMREGFNQYAPMPGDLGLRVAISQKIERCYNSLYDPGSEITVTSGATQALFTVFAAVIKPGDEVIYFEPAYDSYDPCIKLNGGIPVPITLEAPDFRIDWDQVSSLVSDKTKLIVVNNPHNPTGTVFSRDDLIALEAIVADTNVLVLSDEVYEHLVFDGNEHHSVCGLEELKSRSFITASFGKTFHATGWKMGYCCAPKQLMVEFRKVHQYVVFSVNHPIQKALTTYLSNPQHYEKISRFYQDKRDLFLNLTKDSRFKMRSAQGTYFQVGDYSEISSVDDVEFAKWLTTEKGVAVIPLSVFQNKPMNNKLVRFCFAKKDETLIEAAKILNHI